MGAATLDQARSVLQERFGYPDFRPGQIDVVSSVLEGADTLGVLPTGGGKSLCYQVPALVMPGLTVVISPLIALMKDQVDRLVQCGVAATFLNSTLEPDEVSSRLARAAAGDLKLLYLAPERFEGPDLIRCLRRSGVGLLAVDEAHCISEWGHEFRPSFRRIAAVREALGRPQVVALTATATPAVRRDIASQLRLRKPRVIVRGFDRGNLDYAVHECAHEAQKDEALVRVLRSHTRPAIVYAPTRLAVERIAKRLTRAGVRTLAYHGGLDDAVRHAVQESFMRGGVDAIAATNAFGMGIDKPDVRLVAHYAMPATLEAYYQEAGRAGRDGASAHCVLLHHPHDRLTHEWFIRGTFPPRPIVEQVVAALQRLRTETHVPDAAALVARECKGADARDVEATLALLVREGVLRRPGIVSSVWIRLLATPSRIRRELGADAAEVEVLRTLWRVGREALQQGLVVDLDRLPPPVRGRTARRLLENLRDHQFVDYAAANPGHEVEQPEAVLDAGLLDWSALARRRDAELHKLDMMERYATTAMCRRAFVLGYFGERTAVARCDGCDNCRRKPRRNASSA